VISLGLIATVNAQRNDRNHSDKHDHAVARNDRNVGTDRGSRNDRIVSTRTIPNRVVTTQVNRTNRYTPTSVRRDNYRVPYTTNNYRNTRRFEERRYFLMGGPRYRTIPYSYSSVYYGGRPYYYTHGLFYYMLDGFYQAIYPPFGIRVRTLPYGYVPLNIGRNPYYYYNGIYYRKYDNLDYEVIQPPVGAVVTSLPQGSKAVLLNGEKFYELNGTYYKEGTNENGQLTYTVVGKNGTINNSDDGQTQQPLTYKVGDLVPELPSGCKLVNLNGEKLYVSPDDIYFKEVRDGNQISYKVVGNTLQ
jgi:hypothetical protein